MYDNDFNFFLEINLLGLLEMVPTCNRLPGLRLPITNEDIFQKEPEELHFFPI